MVLPKVPQLNGHSRSRLGGTSLGLFDHCPRTSRHWRRGGHWRGSLDSASLFGAAQLSLKCDIPLCMETCLFILCMALV